MTVRFLGNMPSENTKGEIFCCFDDFSVCKICHQLIRPFWTTTLTFHPHCRRCRQLQRRLQSLPPARLDSASQFQPGSGGVPAGERIRSAVHVLQHRSDMCEMLHPRLQNVPRDPEETREPEIQRHLQTGEPIPAQRWRGGSRRSSAGSTGRPRRHVETLVDSSNVVGKTRWKYRMWQWQDSVKIAANGIFCAVIVVDEYRYFVVTLMIEYYILTRYARVYCPTRGDSFSQS